MKKRYKVLSYILIVTTLFTFFMVAIFYSPKFQSYIISKVTNYYASKINLNISIKNVDFLLFRSFELNQILIDNNKDTLLYIEKLIIKLDSLNFEKNDFYAEKIIFENLKIKYEIDKNGISNIYNIIKYYTEGSNNNDSANYNIFCKNFIVENSEFQFIDNSIETSQPKKTDFDYKNIYLKNFNAKILDTKIDSNQYEFTIEKLSFNEKSGFQVSNLNFKTIFKNNELAITNLKLLTNNSDLDLKSINFKFNDISDFKDFQEKVNTEIIIQPCKISSYDLKFFHNNFKKINISPHFSGKIQISPDSIFFKNFKLQLSRNTKLRSTFSIKHYIDSSKLKVETYNFISQIDVSDYNKFELFKLINSKFTLKKDYLFLSKFSFAGKLLYTKNNSYITGVLSTKIGEIHAKIENIYNDNLQTIDIKMSSKSINTARISGIPELKQTSISSNTQIYIDNNNTSYTTSIQLDKLHYKSNVFNNITIIDNYKNNNHSIEITSKDSSLQSTTSIIYNNIQGSYNIKLKSQLDYINLSKINIDTIHNNAIFKGYLITELSAKNIFDITGFLEITDSKYLLENDSILLDTFRLTSENIENQKIIKLKSDYLNLDIRGIYNLNNLERSLNNFIIEYIPTFSKLNKEIILKKNKTDIINFTADFKNLEKINKYFFPEINIGNSSHTEFYFNAKQAKFDFYSTFPLFKIHNTTLKNLKIDAFTLNKVLNFNINSKFKPDSSSINYTHTFLYNGLLTANTLKSIISWHNSDTIIYGGDFSFTSNFTVKNDSKIIKSYISPTQITIANTVWNIKGESAIYKDNSLKINNLQINNNKQKILINGLIGENFNDVLSAEIYNFNIW